jgi:hypothetical protein
VWTGPCHSGLGWVVLRILQQNGEIACLSKFLLIFQEGLCHLRITLCLELFWGCISLWLSSYIIIRKLLDSVFNLSYFRYSYAGGKFTHIVLEANSYLVCQKILLLGWERRVIYCVQSRDRWFWSTSIYVICVTSVLPVILRSHPLVLQVFSSLKVFRTKFCMLCFYLYHADCMSHPSLFAHPIFNGGWSTNVKFLTTLCRSNCILSPLTFSFSFPEIIFRIPFPNTAYWFSSCNVRHQTSFP